MSDLADKLREQIEARHARALAALKELEDYLDNPNLLQESKGSDGAVQEQPVTRRIRRRTHGRANSFRAQVLAVIGKEWATVDQIAEQSGLAARQVRGVINAPSLARRIERRDGIGGTEYHFRPEGQS